MVEHHWENFSNTAILSTAYLKSNNQTRQNFNIGKWDRSLQPTISQTISDRRPTYWMADRASADVESQRNKSTLQFMQYQIENIDGWPTHWPTS